MTSQFLASLEREVSRRLLYERRTDTFGALNKGAQESRVTVSRSQGLKFERHKRVIQARKFDRPKQVI